MFRSPVTILYLPEECFDGGRPLLNAVMDYYDSITNGWRNPENSGAIIKTLRDTELYIGEIQNGGHGQHLDNMEPTKADVIAIRDAFIAASAFRYANVVERYIEQAAARLDRRDTQGERVDYYSLLSPLDREYFALERERHPDEFFRAYLKDQPWVRKMPGVEFDRALKAMGEWFRLERQLNVSVDDAARFVGGVIRWMQNPHSTNPPWSKP